MYANVQGVRGKKACLQHVMDTVEADIVMLTETMTKNVSVDYYECINPKESIGQNVCIILAKTWASSKKIKLYEPNETINMIGVRLEISKKLGLRLYTAHLKQQSTNSREDISCQFDEIRNQFKSANIGREPMLLACDANVHVGGEVIRGCYDKQDWGGQMLMEMVEKEGLTLVNSLDICNGVVTRVDPRNGTQSTIDIVIVNTFMLKNVQSMDIDEAGSLKLKRYGKKVTETDHNTITVKLAVDPVIIESEGQKEKIFNVRNIDERKRMQSLIEQGNVFDSLFTDNSTDINMDMELFMKEWNTVMEKSFHLVKPSRSMKRRIDGELKVLLDEEKWIRNNIHENPERGRRISSIQKKIGAKIAENVEKELEEKVHNILESDKPHSKVFSIRRKRNSNRNLDFPLKDENGVIQVSKAAIDQIITNHFTTVFAQNPVPIDELWQEYWSTVDEVFDLLDEKTQKCMVCEEPTLEEIEGIIDNLEISKATYGPITIDLIKLGGKKIVRLVHRCILKCMRLNTLPKLLRKEKISILLKNNGVIDNINDYRGIFLRHVILSVFQKWLYSKNAEVVDSKGSEYACGGRKKRSASEALLIVKLVQDYSKWTRKQIIIEFLDIEKFFDSMNFKQALIQLYLSGVNGKHWQCYKTINERKICIPHIPSGKCSAIEVENIFAQGSCDAVLVAWPLVDAESKRKNDPFAVDCCIEGIPINRVSFIDDLTEFTKNSAHTEERNTSAEVFEKKNRLKFKVSKCKVMPSKKTEHSVSLNNVELEVVKEHKLLGTIISSNGERIAERKKRVKQTSSVANEIVLICKETELSRIRLRYVKLLTNACLDSKVKYGCALWNIVKSAQAVDDLNRIKPRLLKRVMELPQSTPSAALQYDFGVNDLSLDVLMEKVILAAETCKLSNDRIVKKLLQRMMAKNVPGFCTEVTEACSILGVNFDELLEKGDIRSFMKQQVREIQGTQLFKQMVASSKLDKVLLSGFKYDGKVMKYIQELVFVEARAVFMTRYRMTPTKANFPGRWKGQSCNVCGFLDTDEHVFSCPGYRDLITDDISLEMFYSEETLNDIETLSVAAKVMHKIIERMEYIQDMETQDAK